MKLRAVASRYRTDVGTVWYWIASGKVITSPDGKQVRLTAEKRDKEGAWIVEENAATADR